MGNTFEDESRGQPNLSKQEHGRNNKRGKVENEPREEHPFAPTYSLCNVKLDPKVTNYPLQGRQIFVVYIGIVIKRVTEHIKPC